MLTTILVESVLTAGLDATVGASKVYYHPELTSMVVNSYGHIQVVNSRYSALTVELDGYSWS